MTEIFRVNNLVRNYIKPSRNEEKEEIEVLKNLSFSFGEKEFIGIMGKSGCGKTTLLKILGMIDKPTSGRIFFKGKEVTALWDEEICDIRRRQIGFIFQDFYLMDSISVEENIMLPMILDKVDVEKCFYNAKMFENIFEIKHLSKKNPYELSGGEKQRVAICRALVNNPDLILADEPTGNLDSKSSGIVMNTLKDINVRLGKTIVMVTHDPYVASFCDRIVFLKDGKIIRDISKNGTQEKHYQEIVEIMREL